MMCWNKKQSVAFSDILRGLQHAINSAQEILQVQQLQNIMKFFHEDGKPEIQKMIIDEKEVNIPLMTLVPRSYLTMEDVEIKFKTKIGAIGADKIDNFNSSNDDSLSCANMQMQMDGISVNDKNIMEVTIHFKNRDTPEGISRIIDEYNKKL